MTSYRFLLRQHSWHILSSYNYYPCRESKNIWKDLGYSAWVAYYAEIIYLSTKLGALCRIVLPIHPLWDLRLKLSVHLFSIYL
jgi:hypothetical protein